MSGAGDKVRARGHQLVHLGLTLVQLGLWKSRPPWPGFGEPLNGQPRRRAAVDHILGSFDPDGIIETGTFLGHTTTYFARFGCPVVTVEADSAFYLLARHRLRRVDGVEVIRNDSRVALRELAANGDMERPFIYLDAHWGEDLPLAEEMRIIGDRWPDAVVVIDDFQVPGEPGFGYDAYGGVPLSLEHLSAPEGAVLRLPADPPTDESAARRGTLYLAVGPRGGAALQSATDAGLLRPAQGPGE